MNKDVAMITGSVIGGAVAGGVNALLPESDSPLLNFAVAIASGFGAYKVVGSTTQTHLLKGALMGSAVVQVLSGIKKLADKHLSSKLTGNSTVMRFAQGAVGLACPCEDNGLHGAFMGADGQVYEYDESGLNGTYMDEAGNVFEMEDGLNGVEEAVYVDEYGNIIEGLNGAEGDIYGIEDEFGLHGSDDDDVYQDIYVSRPSSGEPGVLVSGS